MEASHLQRKKVYGGIQRLIHAWIGLSVLALIVMGWAGKFMDQGPYPSQWIQAHIGLGYTLTVGVVLRIVWGIIGPEHARFSSLWSIRNRKKKAGWGHEPLASISYLLFYACLLVAIVSGFFLAAIQYDQGPLARILFDDFSFHEIAFLFHDVVLYLSSAFVFLHIAALLFHEKERGYPIAQSMLSGYQYRPTTQENHSHD